MIPTDEEMRRWWLALMLATIAVALLLWLVPELWLEVR